MSKRRALLIGVPKYLSDSIKDLEFIPHDIRRLHESLETSGYLVETVGIEETKPVSIGILRSAVRKICREANKGDTLFVCYSGHGLHYKGQSYLVPYDVDIGDPNIEDYLVPVDFGKEFEVSLASTILFFIDACREGIDYGSQSIVHYMRWGEDKLHFAKKRAFAYIFSCQAGEVSRYLEGSDGFSLFSRALAEVVHKDNQIKTFGQFRKYLQHRLDELAETNKKPRQKIRIRSESGAINNILDSCIICSTTQSSVIAPSIESRWSQFAMENELWNENSPLIDQNIEDLKFHVGQLAGLCQNQWECAMVSLPRNPWCDELFPIRVVERIAFLVSQSKESIGLNPAEISILIAAPFVYEAVLSSALIRAAEINPFDLKLTNVMTGIRGSLEKTYLSNPHFIRKAEYLKTQDMEKEHDAIASWLMFKSLLRLPEIWAEHPQGYISEDIIAILLKPKESQFDLTRDTLNKCRLLEMARCIHADPERIGSTDRPIELKTDVYLTPGMQSEQNMREKFLAYILALAGKMALDVRTFSELLVDHIGLSDPLTPEEVVRTASKATWYPDAGRRSLKVNCRHPALDLELREQVRNANSIIDIILQKVHKKQDYMELLHGIPIRLTTHHILPEILDSGGPAYQTPHLRFQLSHNEIRELLMGDQLYGDPTLAIRELYQNALDACRYRLARTNYLKQMGKEVSIDWEGEIIFKQGIDKGRPFIECKDNGIGMGIRELKDAFSKAGRRFSDLPEFIEEQAEWLQSNSAIRLYPNSQFGIGVFSYFMLADELLIDTCRLDRWCNPIQRFAVQISGSGSLFRIIPKATSKDAGTCIRLYLTKTEYKGKRLSCLETLEKHLWVAQFKTTVFDIDKSETWLPDIFKNPEKKDILCSGNKDKVWWINHSNYSKSGLLLSDGIVTDQKFDCAVVNLTEKFRPRLTLDRQKVLNWDKNQLKNLLRSNADAFKVRPKWLTYNWLWKLEKVDFVATANIINVLLSQDKSVELPVSINDNKKNKFPLDVIGCFHLDEKLFDVLSEGNYSGRYDRFDNMRLINKLESLERKLFKNLQTFKNGTLKSKLKNLLNDLERMKNTTQFSDINFDFKGFSQIIRNISEKLQTLEIRSFESEIESLLSDLDNQNQLILAAEKVAIAEKEEHRRHAVDRLKKRLPKFLFSYRVQLLKRNGLKLPSWFTFDKGQIGSIENFPILQAGDAILLSIKLNGEPPWINSFVTAIHMAMASLKYNISFNNVFDQLKRFQPMGIKIQDIDLPEVPEILFEDGDQIVFSDSINGEGPWITGKVLGSRILRVSEKLNEPVGNLLRRFQKYASLGITIPDVEPDLFEDVTASKQDLILISKNLNGKSPWIEKEIPISHILNASEKLNETFENVLKQLQKYSLLKGIQISYNNLERIDDKIFSINDVFQILKGKDIDFLFEKLKFLQKSDGEKHDEDTQPKG